jgi:hypothetical protein
LTLQQLRNPGTTLAQDGVGLDGYVYLPTPEVPLDVDEVTWTVSS